MRFRISQWLDTSDKNVDEYPVVYGIQRNIGEGWRNVTENGKPLLYPEAKDANEKVKEFEKRGDKDE